MEEFDEHMVNIPDPPALSMLSSELVIASRLWLRGVRLLAPQGSESLGSIMNLP